MLQLKGLQLITVFFLFVVNFKFVQVRNVKISSEVIQQKKLHHPNDTNIDQEEHVRNKRFAATATAAIGAIAGGIGTSSSAMINAGVIAGTTLLGTSALAVSTALSTAYSVTTTIEIINHSKWDLVYPTAYTEWGYIKSGHE